MKFKPYKTDEEKAIRRKHYKLLRDAGAPNKVAEKLRDWRPVKIKQAIDHKSFWETE